jgi:hypothetical protein
MMALQTLFFMSQLPFGLAAKPTTLSFALVVREI